MNKQDEMKELARQHAAFRQTPQWIVFRKFMLSSHNMTCDFCRQPYKQEARLHIHHKYATNYTRLEADRFMVLCDTCHQFIHKKEKAPRFAGVLVGKVDLVTLPAKGKDK
jgi:hypothetical protein